ncbi:hypothetical protein GH741_07015 [Aquibacillus halophilus]|uniref:Cell wall elongation regulator TseB-like domain-containing protein n=1 Tax=Aquibacillus halophilus TaxID=930132 RepID=A0A6A8D9J9_9BACI|nr:DUF5590 domain-containing protein [Aquibacillus halophilus]MRH42433.1 hypothetical protein [Aquibacillus halophilus]
MEKQFLPFTAPNWLKWAVIALLVIFIGVITYLIDTYNEVQANRVSGFDESKEVALTETELVSIDVVSRFHGEKYYHVVLGRNDDGNIGVVYISMEDDDEEVLYFDLNSFVSEEEMLSNWRDACSGCNFLDINLAIDKEQPLWEIKYIDSKDRYVFEYYTVEDGSSYELYFRLQRSLY